MKLEHIQLVNVGTSDFPLIKELIVEKDYEV